MAQVFGFLSPMWETQKIFPAPGFAVGLPLGVVGIWGTNH